MEIYRTNDGKVTKFVHLDGSETAIKNNYTCDTDGGTHGTVLNKYNVFISSDVGCPISCKFCYLTTKKFGHYRLSADEVFTNVIEAIEGQIKYDSSLRDKYLKISWMGMSDPMIEQHKTLEVTDKLIDYVISNNLCCGIDGIDMATTLPFNNFTVNSLNGMLYELYNTIINNYAKLNPERNYRNPIRIFYSLHAGTANSRNEIIPTKLKLHDAINRLGLLNKSSCALVYHYIILDGINDLREDIEGIINIVNSSNAELRILRYNKCPGSIYNESKKFDEIVAEMKKRVYFIKVQASPGSEIFASCGQFLMGTMK